ncbi:hypothetical protein SAMN05192554_12066 [Haloarchaeobius iranensis]|uniref:Uncharacterized protein n=1 Tax=Haloarchaeobius iranensis TaxID=996166 RepID=A0A1G9ZIF4_9EURY|nr:hypothetical protein SAMN05192554_12066 [Haloarchaeobius iranensis]
MALSAAVAICNVERGVHVCLVLRNPTRRVRTVERHLRRTGALFSATVARLRGVGGIHRLHTNSPLSRLVANLAVHLRKAPSVKATVHERAVVHVLTDVGQVFQHQYGVLESVGVGDDLRRDRVNDVVDLSPQLVPKGFSDSFASALLKASSRREIRLTELPNRLAFVVPEVGCSRGAVARSRAIWLPIRLCLMTALVTVTHRYQRDFPGMTTLYERFLDTVRADLEELPR